jgi:hypothetical protein
MTTITERLKRGDHVRVRLAGDSGWARAIYPSERGVRIISKHFDPRLTLVAIDPTDPPALEVFII